MAARERGAASCRAAATARRRPKAATARRARRATSAATTTSGSIPARPYTIVNGERRTSLIVDPPDGRVPPLTPAARAAHRGALCATDVRRDAEQRSRARTGARRLRRSGAAAARRALPARLRLDLRAAGAAELLLQQPASDRADAGPRDDPQRDGARRAHRADERRSTCRRHIRKWMGDSVGAGKATRWSSTPPTSPTRRGSAGLERRTCTWSSASRASTRTLLYRFTIEDPTTWDRPWTGEYAWPATDELDLRIRLPRGQLRAREHAARRAAAGSGRGDEEARGDRRGDRDVMTSMAGIHSLARSLLGGSVRPSAHHAFGGEFDREPARAAEGPSSRSSGSILTPGSTWK